jgi:tRNA-dihydrouridine synthase
VFSETLDALSPDAQREWKLGVIRRHLALIREHFREKYGLIQIKKHLAWYTEGLGHATDCRRLLFQAATPEEAWTVFMRFWDARPPVDSEREPRTVDVAE